MNNLVGNQLGKYTLIRLLGHGGMAEVYEAFQPGTDRPVAIKVLRSYGSEPPEAIARFKREARSIAQLRHTNIIQVFDFDVDHDRYYMVMECIRGGTLHQYIAERGTLPADEALHIAIQLADGLSYAHQRGVIHRDIKPHNILFADSERKHPILTDFGIARILGETAVTADGRFIGSPAYLSPEVARGEEADERSDIYGLGLTLYEMVTGRVPFTAAGSTGIVMQHLSAPLPSPRQFNPAVHPALEMILDKALSKSRHHRYQTAAEFKLVLERVEESLRGYQPVVVPLSPPPAGVQLAAGTTIVLPSDGANGDSSTLPLEAAVDESYISGTLPFDEPAPESQPEESKPRRRSRLWLALGFAALLALALLVWNGNRETPDGEPAATASQPALLVDAATETPSPTLTPTLTLTSTLTPTETPTPTLTVTAVPTSSPTINIPPVRENSFSRPTARPSSTPTLTPTAQPTHPPRPTQGAAATQPPAPVGSGPTNVPPGAPEAPGTGEGSGGGGGGTGGSDAPSNPVGDVIDTVGDTLDAVVDPVGDLLDDLLPPLPTICLLGCG